MSAEAPLDDRKNRGRRVIRRLGILGVGVVFGSLVLGFGAPMKFVFHLLAGWVLFLVNHLTEMTWDWVSILTGGGIVVLAIAVLHGFCVSWVRRTNAIGTWKTRWSCALGMLMIVMSCAAISVAGIGHQIAWLAREEWVTDSSRLWALRQQNRLFQLAGVVNAFKAQHEGQLPKDLMTLAAWAKSDNDLVPFEFDKWMLFQNVEEGTPELWSYFPPSDRRVQPARGGILLASPRPVNGRWIVFLENGRGTVIWDAEYWSLRETMAKSKW